jgi:hypothetical protein
MPGAQGTENKRSSSQPATPPFHSHSSLASNMQVAGLGTLSRSQKAGRHGGRVDVELPGRGIGAPTTRAPRPDTPAVLARRKPVARCELGLIDVAVVLGAGEGRVVIHLDVVQMRLRHIGPLERRRAAAGAALVSRRDERRRPAGQRSRFRCWRLHWDSASSQSRLPSAFPLRPSQGTSPVASIHRHWARASHRGTDPGRHRLLTSCIGARRQECYPHHSRSCSRLPWIG